MSALTGRGHRKAHAEGAGGFVLPRPLRRAARFAQALATGRIEFPRHVGVVSMLVLLGATGAYGMVLGGHTRAAMEATTSAFGFAVNKVDIKGNVETSDIDVLQQLHLDGDTSLLTLDVASARKALLELPWVADVEVRKVYPDTLDVNIQERKAFAIWQHGQDLSLIERSGSVIAPFVQGSKFSVLPLYVGLGAETAAAHFDDILSRWPALKARVKAVVRVSDRRWNLVFERGVTVKLPGEHVAQALEDLSVMQKQRSILDRDIAAVDLRLADRITVQLTPEAAARRNAALVARDKLFKKQEHQVWNPDKPLGKPV